MSRALFALLVVAAVLSTALSDPPNKPPNKKCGKNEEWTECGSLCPPTCNKTKLRLCPNLCFIGCQCIKGYLRNENNKCVRPCDS